MCGVSAASGLEASIATAAVGAASARAIAGCRSATVVLEQSSIPVVNAAARPIEAAASVKRRSIPAEGAAPAPWAFTGSLATPTAAVMTVRVSATVYRHTFQRSASPDIKTCTPIFRAGCISAVAIAAVALTPGNASARGTPSQF
jgi:hypothetical protein